MSPSPPLPDACDVLVVGAGPAGSACAQWLARAGRSVLLVDQHAFPRDKVCGDGLIPDAHRALQRLGVHDEVMAHARLVGHVGCIGPRGGRVDVPGRLAVLPRRQLDDILRRAAERAGARFAAPWRFDGVETDAQGRVVGARLRPGRVAATAGPASSAAPVAPAADTPADPDHAAHAADPAASAEPRTVRARWVVLATGASPQALQAAGLCERHTPSGVALRGYVRHAGLAGQLRALEVVWHKRLRKGYGWIFPAPDGVFNIGVGLAHSHAPGPDGRAAMQDVNLREMLSAFGAVHAPARQLLDEGELLGPMKGAPLRCSLQGARYSRPGLLATGEAVGSTYAFTGEGIGKAMETGLLAAEALAEATADEAGGAGDDAVRAHYEAGLLALKPRFDLYERANRVNDHPWLADLLIWRARHSPHILRRMAGVLEETGNPGNLVSLRGIARLFTPGTRA